jgi:hypothetical protein
VFVGRAQTMRGFQIEAGGWADRWASNLVDTLGQTAYG